jgi:dipeptidase E
VFKSWTDAHQNSAGRDFSKLYIGKRQCFPPVTGGLSPGFGTGIALDTGIGDFMNLVFYSGGNKKLNRRLDQALLDATGKSAPSMTYVPFTYYEHPLYFRQFRRYFGSYGVEEILYLAPNKQYSMERYRQAFSTDVIFLSSGNTFTFLRNLRERKLIPAFRKFLKNGGILAGASAGAIVMTPNIMTAVVPSADSDPNHAGLRNLSGMNLVDFEFSPHYEKGHSEELRSYSRFTPFPIMACDDGSGVIVKNGKLRTIGRVFQFRNGKKREL